MHLHIHSFKFIRKRILLLIIVQTNDWKNLSVFMTSQFYCKNNAKKEM